MGVHSLFLILHLIKNYIKMDNAFIDQGIIYLMEFAPRLIGALLILIIGLWLVKFLEKFLSKIFVKNDVDITISKFLITLIKWLLRIFLFIIVISKIGVQTTSFVAMLGAAGLAVGMALQGSLSNFAGGILIIVLKPFKVGDYIQADGVFGTVKEISIFTTKLSTDNNQLAILPNGKLSNENVINYSVYPFRKELLNVEVSYKENIKRVKDILLNLAVEHPQIEQKETPAPNVVVKDLGENGIVLQMQYWCKTSVFWAVHWWMKENIISTFEKENIEIPYAHRQVIITQENKLD